MDWIDWKNVEAVLKEYALDLEALYKAKLQGSERIASGVLLQSISTRVVLGNTSVAVDMDLASYWKYVEWDTKPHFPPHLPILKWVQVKPVLSTADKSLVGKVRTRGKFKGKPYTLAEIQDRIAWRVRYVIAKHGTKGSHDLEDAVKEINALYQQRLEDAISADLGSYTDALIRTLFK